jgi:hypothetical protein
MSKIIVGKVEFTTDVNNELSCKELAEKWSLSEREIRAIAKQLSLTIKKKREKRYVIAEQEVTVGSDQKPTNDSVMESVPYSISGLSSQTIN